jgi:hypothetical protein
MELITIKPQDIRVLFVCRKNEIFWVLRVCVFILSFLDLDIPHVSAVLIIRVQNKVVASHPVCGVDLRVNTSVPKIFERFRF